MALFNLDTQLLPLKGIYFSFLAGMGCLLPFLPVYMKQLGLSSTQTGIIYGIMPFISFFIRPLYGGIADKTRKHKLSLIICILFTGIFHCLLLLIPSQTRGVNTVGLQYNWLESCLRNISASNACIKHYDHKQEDTSIHNITCLTVEDIAMVIRSDDSEDVLLDSCIGRCETWLNGLQNVTCFNGSQLQTNLHGWQLCFNQSDQDQCDVYIIFNTHPHNQGIIATLGPFTIPHHTTLSNRSDSNLDFQGRLLEDEISNLNASVCHSICTIDINTTSQYELQGIEQKYFWLTFVIFLFGNMFYSPVLSLLDAITYNTLGVRRSQYGKQRLWGTFGNGLFAVVSTFTMDKVSKSETGVNYAISFYIFFVLTTISSLIACALRISESLQCSRMMSNIVRLLKYPKIVTFLALITCFGMMTSVIRTFLFWYLQELGSTQIILGMCVLANCIPEALALFFSGVIIERIGHVKCLYIAALGYAARFFCYSFLTNPWYVLFVEPLHCLTFGLMYAAATSYASIIAPKGMSATTQGLLGGLYSGFGMGIGSLISGKLFDHQTGLGPVWTFRLYGFFALSCFAAYVLANTLWFRLENENGSALPRNESELKKVTEEPSAREQLMESVLDNAPGNSQTANN